VLQASGPGVFLKMIFGTKWIFWRAAVVRQGQEQARAGRCDWRARAGVPGAKGNRRGRRLSAVGWWSLIHWGPTGLGQERTDGRAAGGRVCIRFVQAC
jgi:hypothetical protein